MTTRKPFLTTAALGLLGAAVAAAPAAGGPSASSARKCNKYTERKVGQKCKKRAYPAIGQYHSADGTVQIAVYKQGAKQLLTVEVHIAREKLSCTPNGSQARGGGIAKLSAIPAAKTFSRSGQSQYGPTTLDGKFISALKLQVTGSVSGLTNAGNDADRCGGTLTTTVTLKPGIYRGPGR